MSASRTLAAVHSSEMGLYEVLCDDLPSIPLIVLHSLVLSVLLSMLSTNSLHCVLL